MFTFLTIAFYVELALAALVVGLDTFSSKDFIYYGLTERNRLARDKYGFFDVKKNLITSGAMIGVCAVAGFGGLAIEAKETLAAAVIFMLFPILWRGHAYFDNVAAAKRGRIKQSEFLEILRSFQSFEKPTEERAALFNRLEIKEISGRIFYPLFGWIFVDDAANSAVETLQDRIASLALKPESEWFPK